jgi:hypothetical protein
MEVAEELNMKSILEQILDHLMPELTIYETTMYFYLLRHSHLTNNSDSVRVDPNIMAAQLGKRMGKQIDHRYLASILKSLEEKKCIRTGDVSREGTSYTVILPEDIPIVAEKMAVAAMFRDEEEDYFTDAEKRKIIFERDNWTCQYCFEKLTPKNVALDHYIPRSRDGKSNKENLETCCLVCNGIKSGRSYVEAAPLLLKNIGERKKGEES